MRLEIENGIYLYTHTIRLHLHTMPIFYMNYICGEDELIQFRIRVEDKTGLENSNS